MANIIQPNRGKEVMSIVGLKGGIISRPGPDWVKSDNLSTSMFWGVMIPPSGNLISRRE